MKRLVVGILAHVDAGKTTLSEALLYKSGVIQKLGRVDKKDAFLDTHQMERARGITIFSKQAVFQVGDLEVILLDTPGHVDFSAEMERTLQVLDYAILVINGMDGVQAHTRTLWRLLQQYNIPTFLFINKMDQTAIQKNILLAQLKSGLHENCFDFGTKEFFNLQEEIAMCEEEVMEQFLEQGMVTEDEIRRLILYGTIYPCYFGSALKLEGIGKLLEGMEKYTRIPDYPEAFGARVYKIARDAQGNRMTYLKITGGSLKVRGLIGEEKVNQIRIYSGEKYETMEEVEAGTVCAVTGLSATYPGQGIGIEEAGVTPYLLPVLTYRLGLPEGLDARQVLPKLKELEEEDPQLHVLWEERLQEIQVQLMGEVQMEILQGLVRERFGIEVSFGEGSIVYKETIEGCVEGIGHFEPLRHYAEVHLLLEAGVRGSGLVFGTECKEEMLDKNWQQLVLTHLKEKEHKGVLTGASITDMKIQLVAGRGHQKHTQGGDFRQATYRAVRQGLKQAHSVLLEPYYEFRLMVPAAMIGRGMIDLELRNATFGPPIQEGENAVLQGTAPVSSLRGYQKEVLAYTRGLGRIFCTVSGYDLCHNIAEVVEQAGYDSEADLENPTGSVFCANGAGFTVGWEEVGDYMHVESVLPHRNTGFTADRTSKVSKEEALRDTDRVIDMEEIESILQKTYYANRKQSTVSPGWKRRIKPFLPVLSTERERKPAARKEEYLLVDGYNIIFAWEELKEVAEVSIDGARGLLMDILCNYQAIRGGKLLLVFDAYRVPGHVTEMLEYHNIFVVYTKEAETADGYIERFAHENGSKYQVTVATSDGMEQIIIRGQGCNLLSARELREEVIRANDQIQSDFKQSKPGSKNHLKDLLPEEVWKKITFYF